VREWRRYRRAQRIALRVNYCAVAMMNLGGPSTGRAGRRLNVKLVVLDGLATTPAATMHCGHITFDGVYWL
jgi:hypothetical protein